MFVCKGMKKNNKNANFTFLVKTYDMNILYKFLYLYSMYCITNI